MSKIKSSENVGQLALVAGEHAKDVLPAAWLMSLHDANVQSEVQARFGDFCECVRSFDRHRLLSLTALYTLTGGASALQSQASYPQFADLEFLQAIALTGMGSRSTRLVPEDVLPFWRELTTQCYVANQAQRNGIVGLEAIAQVHASYYRNPYGDDFFDSMMTAITTEYDSRFIRDGSFARKGLAIIALRWEILQRYQEYAKSLRVALRSNRSKVSGVLRRIKPEMDDVEFKETFGALEIDELRSLTHNTLEDNAVGSMFILGEDWIKSQEDAGLPMRAVLDCLSLSEVDVLDPGILVGANPIWNAPIVKSSEDYALYSPITLASFPFRCLLMLLSNDEKAKIRLEKIRGWFVEQEGKRILEKAFPSANVQLGGYWYRTPTERVEADLLVLTANRLFILEAKGALIPDRVRFGVRDATVQFLKKIWGKATAQGTALANHLEDATAPVKITDVHGSVVMTIEPDKLWSISRFGISVEQVGPLMNAPDMLRDAGILNETALGAPCIMLSELAQVLKHARDELYKLHYLLRRSQVARKYQIIGDEMDIYTTYAQYGFSNLPDPGASLMLLGASYSLDEYRDRRGRVNLPSDSALRCSPYFQSVLREAKERKSAVYLEIGLLLLDIPYEQQQELDRQLRKLSLARTTSDDLSVASMAIDVLGERTALAIALVRKNTNLEQMRGIGLNVAASVAEQLNANQVACIVRFEGAKIAYDAIYFFGGSVASRRKARAESK